MTDESKSQTTSEPVAEKESLALITARTLRDHMASVGKGKHVEALDAAIKDEEGAPAPAEDATEDYDED